MNKKERDAIRNQRPEVKTRKAELVAIRKQRPDVKQKWRDYINNDYNQRPEVKQKRTVREKTRRAVKDGVLVRPALCERCNCVNNPTEVHHLHYDQPDSWKSVLFLCEPCHEDLHTDMRKAQEAAE